MVALGNVGIENSNAASGKVYNYRKYRAYPSCSVLGAPSTCVSFIEFCLKFQMDLKVGEISLNPKPDRGNARDAIVLKKLI